MCDEAVVVRQPPELPGAPETQHGPTGVLEAFELWPQQWDDYGIEVLYVRDVGDHVVAHARNWARGKGSGIELETLFTSVFTFARGKVVEWQIFLREEEALCPGPYSTIRATFPAKQRLADNAVFEITVRNAGDKVIPNLATTIRSGAKSGEATTSGNA